VSGEERSLGTKNMLDHMKRCLLGHVSAHKKSDTTSTSDIESSSTSLNSSFSSASSSSKGGCSSSMSSSKAKRPSFKTLDSFGTQERKLGRVHERKFVKRLLLLLQLHTCL